MDSEEQLTAEERRGAYLALDKLALDIAEAQQVMQDRFAKALLLINALRKGEQ